MKKIGLLFSGQGSEMAGMGLDLYQAEPEFRAVIDQASQASQLDLYQIMQSPAQLAQTQYAQPAIVAMSVGIAQLLATQQIPVVAAAGLSLGEYAALIANHTFTLRAGTALVATRGRLMQQAIDQQAGQMAAILNASPKQVSASCQALQAQGHFVAIANYNSSKQMVVGGTPAGIATLQAQQSQLLPDSKIVPLKVAGAFHTALLGTAAQKFEPYVAKIKPAVGDYPVFSNTTKQPFEREYLTQTLVLQMAHATHFGDNLLQLKRQGVEQLIEVGPGKTLSQFARQTVPSIERFNISNHQQLITVLKKLKEVNP